MKVLLGLLATMMELLFLFVGVGVIISAFVSFVAIAVKQLSMI